MMSAKANAVTTRHLHARVQSLTAEVKRLRKQLAKSRREYDAVVARVGNRDTSQVRADAHDDEPLGGFDSRSVRLRVSELVQRHGFARRDLVGRAMSDEDGLAAPLDLCGVDGVAVGQGRATASRLRRRVDGVAVGWVRVCALAATASSSVHAPATRRERDAYITDTASLP